MESFTYAYLPEEVQTVSIALFRDVRNAAALRSRLVFAANMPGEEGVVERDALNFAFIDAKPIASLLHLQTAIHQASLSFAHGALRTKTVHSEILWAFNLGNNITESLRRFGVSDSSTEVIVVRVGPSSSTDILAKMKTAVDGNLVDISRTLSSITNWDLVRKYYKLDVDTEGPEQPRVKGAAYSPSIGEIVLMNEIVVTSVAMKNAM